MLQVYTSFLPLLERLDLMFDDLKLINEIADIDEKRVVVTEAKSAIKILSVNPKAKILVLSDIPSFPEGQILLQKGIKGYANTYIHKIHLDQAIQMIEDGNIWLYPSFMHEIISRAIPDPDQKNNILNKLTLREQETALLVASGKTNKEIAIELGITERTVKAHMSSIFEKIGVHDRFALAVMLK